MSQKLFICPFWGKEEDKNFPTSHFNNEMIMWLVVQATEF